MVDQLLPLLNPTPLTLLQYVSERTPQKPFARKYPTQNLIPWKPDIRWFISGMLLKGRHKNGVLEMEDQLEMRMPSLMIADSS